MIYRGNYIQQLLPFVNKPIIKVLTGIRRSGKSVLLQLIKEELINQGIKETQIITMNFESFAFMDFLNAKSLYAYIQGKIKTKNRYYLLIDEIQEVAEWEKVINSMIVDFNIDIYLTGSNSKLLSSELATYLAGRFIEIPVFTLSYQEYLKFKSYYSPPSDNTQSFTNYLRLGGFPMLHTTTYSETEAQKIVYDIYSSVILRDTVQRYNIRDIELLDRIVKYTLDNIGHTFSGKNIADYFKSQYRKIDVNTVYNYLNALEAAFILYRVPRYDIMGKEILKTQEKFYVSDISIIYAVMGNRDRMIAEILENIVFLELKRRHYHVYIGKLKQTEIDFVAEKGNTKIYIQVAYKLENKNTIDREFGNLLAIKDQYPKYVLSMDDFWKDNIEGVRHIYIPDFLQLESF